MKLKFLTYQLNPIIESKIQKGEHHVLNIAVNNGKILAANKLPELKGDDLNKYTGEIKAAIEKLAAEVFMLLQPASHAIEAKIDAEYHKLKDKELASKMEELRQQNKTDSYLLNDNDTTVESRIIWAVVASLVIVFGELVFNTKAFQVTGENLLMAFVLSISVTSGISFFSHQVPRLYKSASSPIKKRLIVTASFLIATIVFFALAMFRTSYLANHGIYVNPLYFVAINFFFFIVSCLLSYFVLPTWHEIGEWWKYRKALKIIAKRDNQIKHLEKEKKSIPETTRTDTKERVKHISTSHYLTDRFKKMHSEGVEKLKSTIIALRSDHKVPDCFSQTVKEPEINQVSFINPAIEGNPSNHQQNQQIK